MNTRHLEVCCAGIDSVRAAVSGGADRIELCASLETGGVTPSAGLIAQAAKICADASVILHVLIRPRSGDFVYDEDEIVQMVDDIYIAKQLGADGVAVGALTADGSVDIYAMRQIMLAADDVRVTFHRAFDHCPNCFEALEDIIALGCDAILTSGQQESAELGIDTIAKLIEQSRDRIQIMPGAGVSPANANKILAKTGANWIHASAKKPVHGKKHGPAMGSLELSDTERFVTDASVVGEIKNNINI